MPSPRRKPKKVLLITRVDPVTGETFIPRNRNQIFASSKNRRKYYYNLYREKVRNEFMYMEGNRVSFKRKPFVIACLIFLWLLVFFSYKAIIA